MLNFYFFNFYVDGKNSEINEEAHLILKNILYLIHNVKYIVFKLYSETWRLCVLE